MTWRIGGVDERQDRVCQFVQIVARRMAGAGRGRAHRADRVPVVVDALRRADQGARAPGAPTRVARLDHGGVDAERLAFLRQCLADGLHGGLGRAVDPPTGACLVAAGRRYVHDVSVALLAHLGQHGPRDVQEPEHVDAKHTLDLRRARFFDRAEQAVACVVDQRVDATEAPERARYCGARVGLVGDVQRHDQELLVRA